MENDDVLDPPQEKPGLTELLGQLGDDAARFARAEVHFLKAQADERVAIALPALLMIAISGILALSIVIAVLIVSVMLLAPWTGLVIAILLIAMVSALLSLLLYRTGIAQMRRVFRKLEV